jgi:hypothetical protein
MEPQTAIPSIKVLNSSEEENKQSEKKEDFDTDSFGGDDENMGSLEELVDHDPMIVHNINNVQLLDLDGWSVTKFFLRLYLLLILVDLYIIGLLLINILIPQLKAFNSKSWWLGYVLGGITVVTMPIVHILRRRTPFNLLACTFLITCFGWTVGFLSSLTNSYAIVAAFCITIFITILLFIYVSINHQVQNTLPLMLSFVLISIIISSSYSLISRLAFDHGQLWHVILVTIVASSTSLYTVIKSSRVMDEYTYGETLFALIFFFDLIDVASFG